MVRRADSGGGPKAAIHSGLDSALGSHPCVALSSYQAPPLYGGCPISPKKNHPLWKKSALNPGGLGGQSPSRNCHQKCGTLRPDSAGDSRKYKKQLAVSPAHVCAFKCLSRKEIFRMLHTYTADAPRIAIGTKG